jgi:hypothetical protein
MRKRLYPEKAIDEAGLDQKPENFLHAFRRATLSELCTHRSAVFPVSAGREDVGISVTTAGETSTHATHHAFQAMSAVDRTLVPSIGPTIIIASLPSGRLASPRVPGWTSSASLISYMQAAVNPPSR